MFIVVLFALNLVLFSYILFYGICLLSLPFVKPVAPRARTNENQQDGAFPDVSVLVPSHFEGQGLLSCIDSLVEQNYPGAISIHVLICDTSDSSYPLLQEKYSFTATQKESARILFESDDRTVTLHYLGVNPKSAKLNLVIPMLSTPYTAMLDADHRAAPSWLSNSVEALRGSDYVAVQSRRAPLALETFPQLWDSAQNHIGNELVNRAMKKVVGSVFFTGTTAVFKTEPLQQNLFSDCVTEDTYLSYELLAKEQLIDYIPETGSREEVAPDLRSYIARRRRWSCGHNKTFISLIASIFRTSLSWRNKAAATIHGLFYTVPVAVALLLNLFALQMFVQYTLRVQLLLLCFTAVVSFCISLILFGWHRSIVREYLALFFLILPQANMLAPIPLYLMEHELFYFLTAFPYSYYLFWAHGFCLTAPLLLLLIGSRKVPLLSRPQLGFIAFSYPIFFLLDLYACFLGFIDYLLGRPTWSKVQRTFREATTDTKDMASVPAKFARGILAIIFLIVAVVLTNDLTAHSNCGEPKAYLFDPILFVPESDINWELSKATKVEVDSITYSFVSNVESKTPQDIVIKHYLDGALVADEQFAGTHVDTAFSEHVPLGWKSHKYVVKLRSQDAICDRSVPFSSRHIELRDKTLFVNNEPFYIKGVIPSFTPKQTEISTVDGYAQIKELGANAIRLYHAPQELQVDAAREAQLLFIDQPNRSTWDDVNIVLRWPRILLWRRYKKLVDKYRGEPFSLFHNIGNELEIRDPGPRIQKLQQFLKEVDDELEDVITTYSTFFVFLKLATDIYGVNMLDSGETYWRDGLDTILSLDKPFYASEYGGFVAATEKTPPSLRIYRLFTNEEKLRNAHALGYLIHQSHDNWTQAVIDGMNDPFTPDHPDDLRGIWNRDNKPKLVKRFVEMLFSDIEAELVDPDIVQNGSTYRIRLRNRRAYKLSNVLLFRDDQQILGPLEFAANEEHIVEVTTPVSSSQQSDRLTARYTTHAGLSMQSIVDVAVPQADEKPVILNTDLLHSQSSSVALSAELLFSNSLRVLLPKDWDRFTVNGKEVTKSTTLFEYPLPPAMQIVKDVEYSADAQSWGQLDLNRVGLGTSFLRLRVNPEYPEDSMLVLAGLGATEIQIRYGESGSWTTHETHKYRENLFPLSELLHSAATGDYLYIILPRSDTLFLSGQDNPSGKTVVVKLEAPKVFSPPRVELRKVN